MDEKKFNGLTKNDFLTVGQYPYSRDIYFMTKQKDNYNCVAFSKEDAREIANYILERIKQDDQIS